MSESPRATLPSAWTSAELGELADVQLGKMLDVKRTDGVPMRYLRNINVRWQRIDADDVLEMPFKDSELSRYSLKAGDVLVCEGGEPGRAAVWKGNDPTMKYQKALHRVRTYGGILPEWLVFLLYFDAQRGALSAHFTGSTIMHFPREAIRAYPVLFAPLPEQRRIVAAVESYLTRLDAATATLERVQRNLKRYRAAVLRSAIEGRLVPTEAALARAEGRTYEPASILLERLVVERRRCWEESELAKMKAMRKMSKDETWKAKYVEPVAPDTSDLQELPEGWCWASVEQLGFIASGQTPSGVTTAGAAHGEVPWFRIGDMNAPENQLTMTVATEWLTNPQVVKLGLHVRPPGTIIFPKRGGAIGTNKKRILALPSTYDLNTMGIVPVGGIGAFLWVWFLGVDLSSLADGSNVPQINHGDIATLQVPLPPEEEQKRILNEVNAVLSDGDDASSAVGVNRVRISRLRQSILKWAFEGRLVDQDLTDEPASALLERIRAERLAARSASADAASDNKKAKVPVRRKVRTSET